MVISLKVNNVHVHAMAEFGAVMIYIKYDKLVYYSHYVTLLLYIPEFILLYHMLLN